MPILTQQLAKLGFSENEAGVYLALIELGKARAGKIIRITGLHRNLVYQALEKLASKIGFKAKTEGSKLVLEK